MIPIEISVTENWMHSKFILHKPEDIREYNALLRFTTEVYLVIFFSTKSFFSSLHLTRKLHHDIYLVFFPSFYFLQWKNEFAL